MEVEVVHGEVVLASASEPLQCVVLELLVLLSSKLSVRLHR